MASADDDDDSREFVNEITRTQPAIAAFIRALLPAYHDYMDILQEVNITLWSKRGKYRPGSNFKAWAFEIARYHVLRQRRKMATEGRRLVFGTDLIEIIGETASFPDRDIELRTLALRRCMNELSPSQLKLLRARYVASVSIQDYAREHGKNPATLRAKLRDIRIALRKCILSKLRGSEDPAVGEAWAEPNR